LCPTSQATTAIFARSPRARAALLQLRERCRVAGQVGRLSTGALQLVLQHHPSRLDPLEGGGERSVDAEARIPLEAGLQRGESLCQADRTGPLHGPEPPGCRVDRLEGLVPRSPARLDPLGGRGPHVVELLLHHRVLLPDGLERVDQVAVG
jgi:hypothetical protein